MPFPTQASASGTKLYVTTTEPATVDQAGWEAIAGASWSECGRLTSGGIPKPVRNYNDVNQLDGKTFTITGTENMAEIEYGCVFQPDDAGQAVVDANADGVTLLYWKVELPDGYINYFAGYATGYSPTFTDVEGHVSADFTVKAVFDDSGVGVTRVAP